MFSIRLLSDSNLSPACLQAVAQIDPANGGEVILNGKTPEELGYPGWRARVVYVPQKQIPLSAAAGGRT